jgi:putative ABC transport system permease protein
MTDRQAPASRLPVWLRIAVRELVNNRSFSLPFIINLCIGLTGFLLLDTFKNSISDYLDSRSRMLIGGDLTVSSSQQIPEEDAQAFLALLPTGSRHLQQKSLFSMVSHQDDSRLVDIKAIDRGAPFAGQLLLQDRGPVTAADYERLSDEKLVWIYPELTAQMNLKVGDPLTIGSSTFTVDGVIAFDPYVASAGMAFAPRVMIGLNHLQATGLITLGSRVFQTYIVSLPPGLDPEAADAVTARLKEGITSPNIRVKTHRVAGQDMNRALIYLNDFLGLVSMVALFLAGVGTSFLFRSHLKKRFREIAILLSLGMQRSTAKLVYVAQIVMLGVIATVLSSVLAWLLLPLIPVVFGPVFPEGLEVHPQVLSIVFAFCVGAGGAILVCWPLVQSLNRLPASSLFSEAFAVGPGTERFRIVHWLPALALFFVLSVQQAHSLKVGSLFVAIFLVAFVLFWLLGLGMLRVTGSTVSRLSLRGRIAVLNLTRFQSASLTAFSAIALSSLLMNMIPQVRSSIASEIKQDPSEDRPYLFLFDIQEEQIEPLTALLQSLSTRLDYLSPMVRARLLSINGQSVKDRQNQDTVTREQEFEQRNLSRTYNLSYRDKLTSSETLYKGEPITGSWQEGDSNPPRISVERRFAERLGVDIGDEVTFDVHGVTISGVIANLRKIRWTSFQPNFFFQFQPGVLDEAPKTLLAGVNAGSPAEKNQLQNKIVQQFPNISVIDVTSTITRILAMVNQMTFAIAFMSVLTLLAGFAVLFAIVNHQLQRRIPEITLLKILGAQFSTVRGATLGEFMITGLLASSAGALISIGVSWVVSAFVFEGVFAPDLLTPVLTVVATTGLAVITGWLGSMRALAAKPATLLGAPAYR